MNAQVCVKCNLEKPIEDFYLRKRKLADGTTKQYPRRDCKVCCNDRTMVWHSDKANALSVKERQREWRNNNRDKCESSRLKYRFGITLDQYYQLLLSQDNACAICKTKENSSSRGHKFHVDHCHTTSKVRGLLCNNCNVSLGGFKDSVDVLKKAIDYLTDPPAYAKLRFNTAGDTV